jgi:hypothetical protein
MTIGITPEAAERAAAALPGDHRWEVTPDGNLVLMSPANARPANTPAMLLTGPTTVMACSVSAW